MPIRSRYSRVPSGRPDDPHGVTTSAAQRSVSGPPQEDANLGAAPAAAQQEFKSIQEKSAKKGKETA